MLPAKYFKTKVEKFYLFFDAGFSLFKIKKGETEYGIGWIPLGGYVKISGMIDESMDKEQMKEPAKPWEFRSKPAWQRLIIMVGGVTVNVISGILIYIMIAGVWGADTIMPEDVSKDGYAISPYFKKYGLKDHDIVLEIDGVKLSDASTRNINRHLMVRGVTEIKVLHANGNTELINFPENLEYEILEEGNPFSEWSFPVVADFPSSLDNAKEAGIEIGDTIIQIEDIFRENLGLGAADQDNANAVENTGILLETFGQLLLDGTDESSSDSGNYILQETDKQNRFNLERTGSIVAETFSTRAVVEHLVTANDDHIILEDIVAELNFSILLEDEGEFDRLVLNGSDASQGDAGERILMELVSTETTRIALESTNKIVSEGQIPLANITLNSSAKNTKGITRSAEILVRTTGDIALEDGTVNDIDGFTDDGMLVLNGTDGSSTNAGDNFDLEGATGITI